MKLLYNFICEGKTLICLVGERGPIHPDIE